MARQTVTITVRRRVRIPTNNSNGTKTCPTCRGTGKVKK